MFSSLSRITTFQLGFGIAKALRLDTNYGFGLLALASSPGGGGSNVFTNLLEGDLDLSITMTALSTLLSLGASIASPMIIVKIFYTTYIPMYYTECN